MAKLTDTLARIDALVDARAYAPGAKKTALTKLSKTFFRGKNVPAEIATLFGWHDGQTKPESLHPKNNRFLLSIDEALEAWRFLSDPKEEVLQPWSTSWLPILANGAGDYVCVETAGKTAGSLVAYWHADEDRDIEHASIAAWAEDFARALERSRPKRAAGASGSLAFALEGTSWKKRAAPKRAEVAKAPPGTVFWFRKEFAMNLERKLVCLYVKVDAGGEKTWRHVNAVRSVGSAFARIEEIDSRKKKPDAYEWMSDDAGVASECEGQTVMTGVVGVSRAVREPRDTEVSKRDLGAPKAWSRAHIERIEARSDAIGTAYRAIVKTKHGPQGRVYVKVAPDVWIGAVTPAEGDPIAAIVPRLREKTKYPRYEILRDMEIRDALEFDLDGANDLTTATVKIG